MPLNFVPVTKFIPGFGPAVLLVVRVAGTPRKRGRIKDKVREAAPWGGEGGKAS